MGVFSIQWAPSAKVDAAPFSNVECEFETLAELLAHLEAGGLVCGSILWTRRGETHRERVVTGRRAVGFTKAAVAVVQDCTVGFVEVAS